MAGGEMRQAAIVAACSLSPKTSETRISADKIAEKASRGEDISTFFTNKFTVVRPVRRVNVDLTPRYAAPARPAGRPA
jgi:hypothetical protein